MKTVPSLPAAASTPNNLKPELVSAANTQFCAAPAPMIQASPIATVASATTAAIPCVITLTVPPLATSVPGSAIPIGYNVLAGAA